MPYLSSTPRAWIFTLPAPRRGKAVLSAIASNAFFCCISRASKGHCWTGSAGSSCISPTIVTGSPSSSGLCQKSSPLSVRVGNNQVNQVGVNCLID
ncbi:uncharacterized protein BDR25DRAFT_132059 [Lindgomyces ingoldianus]|uniref:Uncharacterized protein n=1 Tax=Lindgomyces ingoldianus TaxID=673940 RepID=A0ACB6R281_9PLEO|nr:uncharacterized protein BDR25DRAFT_132059 [Lindgomyces ingoldianus]KAF2473434.1 hypothetical protein BDR25DRAFT_132059 [Lindgomyces ingoldianus]